jgi:hypothetical protein
LPRRWNFSSHHGARILRSIVVAENLLAGPANPENGDAPLPPDLGESTLRPLSKLANADLQRAAWRLVSRIAERPSRVVVTRIVRVIEAAINEGSGNGTQPKAKTRCRSLVNISQACLGRLVDHRISPYRLIERLNPAAAQAHFETCQGLITRCHEVLEALRTQFPSL